MSDSNLSLPDFLEWKIISRKEEKKHEKNFLIEYFGQLHKVKIIDVEINVSFLRELLVYHLPKQEKYLYLLEKYWNYSNE